jgi:hypothetical protein
MLAFSQMLLQQVREDADPAKLISDWAEGLRNLTGCVTSAI